MAMETRPSIEGFDKWPDMARASLPVVCQLYDAAPATVWRRVKAGLIPAPIKDGASTRWIVGDLRRALAGKEVAQ
jgi:predicted DNA-binding transcriptional regulator AlpA